MSLPVSLPPDEFKWPAAWEPIPAGDSSHRDLRGTPEITGGELSSDFLADELQREVNPAHPLYGVTCSTVARNRDHSDEILFLTAHPRMPLAFVHLTWQKEKEDSFPCVEGYLSWDEFVDVRQKAQ